MPSRSALHAAAAVALLAAVALGAAATGGIAPFDGGSPAASTALTPTADGPATCDGSSTPETTPEPTPTATPSVHQSYEQTTVTVCDAESDAVLGRVGSAIADNRSLRYTGLSDTEDLPEDRGMLFTYGEESDHTYVMREMSFGIDIVYVGANGTITEIHHAPEPGPDEDGNAQGYPGTGQYVLEVNYEWTAERDVEVGDRVEFQLPE